MADLNNKTSNNPIAAYKVRESVDDFNFNSSVKIITEVPVLRHSFFRLLKLFLIVFFFCFVCYKVHIIPEPIIRLGQICQVVKTTTTNKLEFSDRAINKGFYYYFNDAQNEVHSDFGSLHRFRYAKSATLTNAYNLEILEKTHEAVVVNNNAYVVHYISFDPSISFLDYNLGWKLYLGWGISILAIILLFILYANDFAKLLDKESNYEGQKAKLSTIKNPKSVTLLGFIPELRVKKFLGIFKVQYLLVSSVWYKHNGAHHEVNEHDGATVYVSKKYLFNKSYNPFKTLTIPYEINVRANYLNEPGEGLLVRVKNRDYISSFESLKYYEKKLIRL